MLLVQPIYSDIRDGLWHWVYNITQSLTVSHSHTLFSCHLHRAKLWMFVASYLLVRFVHSFDPWFGSGWTKWCWYLVDIKDIPCYVIIYIYYKIFLIFNFNHAGREFVYGSSSHWDCTEALLSRCQASTRGRRWSSRGLDWWKCRGIVISLW